MSETQMMEKEELDFILQERREKEGEEIILGDELLVSEECKVYAAERDKETQNSYPNDLRYLTRSSVVNTLTTSITNCSWKWSSFDQTGILLNANDNARYSVSSLSEMRGLACSRNLSNLSFETGSIFFFNLLNSLSNSSDESPESILILELCSSNSSNRYCGAYNFTALENIISLVTPLPINAQNNIVASITNRTNIFSVSPTPAEFSIYYSNLGYSFLYLLCNDRFTSLANLSASSLVNLDLETISLNSSTAFSSSSLISASLLANSDQFIHDSFFISNLTSSGTESVTDAIYSSPFCSNFSNSLDLRIIIFLNTSDHLIPGYLSILDFNSSGIDNVTVAIFVPPFNYVNKHKYVDIYKSFGSDEDMYRIKTEKGDLLVQHKVYGMILDNQISFLFLKSDQSKPSLTLVSTSKASIPAVNMLSNVNPVGEWIIPNNLSRTNSKAATINPQPIISKARNTLSFNFIQIPWSLSTINPTITPSITPAKALNSSVKLKPRFINKVTTTTTKTPAKTDLFSFDIIDDNVKKRYLNNFRLNRVDSTTNCELNFNFNISARIGQMNISVNVSGLQLYMPFEWGSAVDISGHCYDNETEILTLVEVDCDEIDGEKDLLNNINQDAEPNIDFNPVIVNPTILPVLSYLANIPEPKSIVNASFGLPNEIYNTSASPSYSHSTFSGFSTFNVSSILSPSFLVCLNNKLSAQNHQLDQLLYKLQQAVYSEPQEFSQISLLREEFLHLLSEPYQDCLLSQGYPALNLSSQDALRLYAQSVLLITLLEHYSLKNLSSFGGYNLSDYINLLKNDDFNLIGENEINNKIFYQTLSVNDSDKCYIPKWKYFWELDGSEKVMTLNQETGEREWQLPMEYQVFDNNGEMYKIKTEKGELLVSEKHKIYVKRLESKRLYLAFPLLLFVLFWGIGNKRSSPKGERRGDVK